VPSLVDRGTILDLTEQRSMLRWLSHRGIRPMLLKWGWPGAAERRFTMTDYIAGRLERALAEAASRCASRIVLVGYCMGGLFCIASALRCPAQVAALGLIATPWDFHAAGGARTAEVAGLSRQFEAALRLTGTLPIDAIQLAFAGVDPAAVARKFRSFGAMPQDDERTRLFVAIGDWLNDGMPLAAPVALECLQGWYGENSPARRLARRRPGGAAAASQAAGAAGHPPARPHRAARERGTTRRPGAGARAGASRRPRQHRGRAARARPALGAAAGLAAGGRGAARCQPGQPATVRADRPEQDMTQQPSPSRLAPVTGGTRGIGAAISEALHLAGRRVVATYRNRHAEARDFHERTGIETVSFDAPDFAESEQAMAAIASRLGPVSILVNNAGIVADASISRMTRTLWEHVLDNHLGAAFNMSKLTFDAMRAQQFGRIVDISSINGQAGQQGQIDYAAAKAGLGGLTRALALDGARYGITVNALAPGYIDTEMLRDVPVDTMAKVVARIPVGRLGLPAEIARGVLFLSADEAGFITGSTVSINGGQHMY